MNLIKEFFYFTKSKLIVFIALSAILTYFLEMQNMVLGNLTWTSLIIVIILLYLILNILWFSFKDIKHFLIGLIVFVVMIGIIRISGSNYDEKRRNAQEECMIETNSVTYNTDVMKCMTTKGYKFYR